MVDKNAERLARLFEKNKMQLIELKNAICDVCDDLLANEFEIMFNNCIGSMNKCKDIVEYGQDKDKVKCEMDKILDRNIDNLGALSERSQLFNEVIKSNQMSFKALKRIVNTMDKDNTKVAFVEPEFTK